MNQSSAGVDKVNALINCHLLTGRIGRPGMGPFSITGQPNAMGGREVGALANTLAAHMDFAQADIDRVGRFWRAPNMARRPGLKAVDLFDAVGRGAIKAVWIMATNPVASLPDADAVREALRNCELSIVSEAVRASDTVDACRIRLPALAWAEKDGTVTNSERGISRQRAFLPPPGEARPDWWIVAEVARRLGFGEAFAWQSAADIFREHAALSAFENEGARDFDIGAYSEIDDRGYETLAPFVWPARGGRGAGRHALLRRRRLLPSGSARALRGGGAARARACPDRRAAAAAEHRTGARPVAHHDAHRKIGAPGRPSPRTDDRTASRRRVPARSRRRRHRRSDQRVGHALPCACM